MKLQSFGAADGVTGSRHLVTLGETPLLLDCGLFQGWKLHRERNWAPLPEALHAARAVVLSHAHLDHSGWLPALVKHGWNGPILATPSTCALAEVLLLDSAHLQEEDARRANRYGYSRHVKALPLYTRADARRALAQLEPLPFGRPRKVGDTTVRFTRAGHLLGAASVLLEGHGQRLLYSGDLGRQNDLLMAPPEAPPDADVVMIESTYGNRTHPPDDPMERLGAIVRETIGRGGSVLMPAFAVGRTQALLLVLQRLKTAGQIPQDLPIVVDSPMAVEATALYRRHAADLQVPRREMTRLVDGVRLVTTVEQSMRLSRARWPMVLLSASGMATGGRVLHHLKAMASDPRHHIVFAGFQVGGSRGARLVAGEREVKVHGEMVPVRASVSSLEGFSGHADAGELLDWLGRLQRAPSLVRVVHGEPDASDTLRARIQQRFGWRVQVAGHGEAVTA